jgi:hypothetical protein
MQIRKERDWKMRKDDSDGVNVTSLFHSMLLALDVAQRHQST